MIHSKNNCSRQNLIISSCDCGLQCGNCLACNCGKCSKEEQIKIFTDRISRNKFINDYQWKERAEQIEEDKKNIEILTNP